MAHLVLPTPKLDWPATFADAIRARRTQRDISARPLPSSDLSNLLFAASGVNRVAGPFGSVGLTAASASNSQEILIFVALASGAYRFEPRGHELFAITDEDLRWLALGPHQPAISPDAPVQLVYVADIDRLEHTRGFDEPGLHDPEVQKSYYFVDAGLIAENVYLFAAAHGLACWFHNCDRDALAQSLHLPATQRVLFAQTVGYPRAP